MERRFPVAQVIGASVATLALGLSCFLCAGVLGVFDDEDNEERRERRERAKSGPRAVQDTNLPLLPLATPL